MRRRVVSLLAAALLTAGVSAGNASAESPSDSSVRAPAAFTVDTRVSVPRAAPRLSAALTAVDPSSRDASLAFWRSDHTPSPASGWNGSVESCDPGTTTQAFKDSIVKRINYFRAMAGVPSDTTIDLATSAKAQQAALMMAANGRLDHFPTESWACYTADGDLAASSSNLSEGSNGAEHISTYMTDPGDENYFAGHRRWILFPQTRQFGTGDVTTGAKNALWVINDSWGVPRPATRDEFVAWPPRGYVPVGVVFRKWSFSLPDADFRSAVVRMTRNGAPYATVKQEPRTDQPPQNGYGENTLVWTIPDASDFGSLPAGQPDVTFTVDVTGVVVAGLSRSFSYTVRAFDPDRTTSSKPDLVVDSITVSPSQPRPGQAVTLSAKVRNAGAAATPTTSSTLFSVDGKQLGTAAATRSLAPGASTTVTAATRWTAVRGSHTLKVIADNRGRIAESSETNNTRTRSLKVSPSAAG